MQGPLLMHLLRAHRSKRDSCRISTELCIVPASCSAASVVNHSIKNRCRLAECADTDSHATCSLELIVQCI
jgi:hypothetical protein